MKIYIGFVILVMSLIASCNKENKKIVSESYLNASEQVIDKWANKEMILPENVELIPNSSYNSTLIELTRSPLKIVAFIDGDCSACINSFHYWQKFSEKIETLGISCKIILYIEAEYKDDLKKNIKVLDIDLPCVFDKEAKFKNLNDLHDQRFQAALLDKDNKVIMIGNPVLNETLSDLYLDTLKELKE